MSAGSLIKPVCIPQEAWDKGGPAARACFLPLTRQIEPMQQRIDELERRLGMNSGNSWLPPSSDGPRQQPVKTQKSKSKRKRGGQFGHPKRTRPLIPTEECDHVEHHRPTVCPRCGVKLSGDDPDPQRHRVTDLPPVKPLVTEHQIHTLECPGCGCGCRGRLPADVPRGSFGPGAVAVVTEYVPTERVPSAS